MIKSFKNILIISLQVIEIQLISFFSAHNFGYELQKELRFVCQALTNFFKIRFKMTSIKSTFRPNVNK